MTSSGVGRVILLTLGWEELPKAWSLYGYDPEIKITEPVPGVLVETDAGWVLLDTGFNPALILDAPLARRFHGSEYGARPILPLGDGDPLLEMISRCGVGVDEIVAVGISHLHNDHAGGIRHFAGKCPIYIQRAELEYGLGNSQEAEQHGIFRIDFDDSTIEWRILDGDTEIFPGLWAVSTPGHTPGHQSFAAFRPPEVGGGLVVAFDAADLIENIDEEIAVGGFINTTAEATLDQIRKLKEFAATHGLELIPGHDPRIWPTVEEGLVRHHRFS